MNILIRNTIGFTLAVFLLAPAITAAHHTWVAIYDRNDIVILEGTVSDINLTSPHSRILVDVTGANGTEIWAGETWPLAGLYRRGLTVNNLVVGDEVRVTGEKARDGRLGLHLRSIYRPSDDWRVWIGLRADTGENTAEGIGDGIREIQLEEESQ
jgi:hypothetical protein